MKEIIITTVKTARYFRLGSYSKETTELLYVLHGYGQLAKTFIGDFQTLSSKKRIIVAPEGLHRYYLKGFDGKVGASWMTREDRENDIKDYLNYLSKVNSAETEHFIGKEPVKIILGFSQGGATAYRWTLNSNFKPDKLILWGSTIPKIEGSDINYLNKIKIIFVFGKKDKFFDENKTKEYLDYLAGSGLKFETVKYGGGHEIQPDILEKIIG